MVVLRATQRLLPMLPASTPCAGASDTALGDWYVDRFVVDPQPLLLLVSSRSLLSLLTPARDVRALPKRLPALVATRLRRLGIADPLIDAEIAAMEPIHVAPTQDRSVLGSMVDFAKAVPSYLPVGEWDVTALSFVESRLAATPCRVTGPSNATLFPERAAPELLATKWHGV